MRSAPLPSARRVILVSETGIDIGDEDVLRAHQHGLLHRAFSIFVFNSRGETLLQCRSTAKRTFGGLWTNTCCGHPRPGEPVLTAAQRRLGEEMGIAVVLEEAARFTYRASDAVSGFTEHEYDHILVGRFDGSSDPDPQEVADCKWVGMDALRLNLGADPSSYSPWLRPALEALDQRSRSVGATGRVGSTPPDPS